MGDSPSSGGRPITGPDSRLSVPTSTGIRVLQACNSCRRRKTKCNGVRPTCGSCILRRLPCSWPMAQRMSPPPGVDVSSIQAPGLYHSESDEPRLKRLNLSRAGRHENGGHLSPSLLQRALEIFYERHHSIEFCSFLHVPSLDAEVLRRRAPFFAHALAALSGLYFSKEDATKEGFASPTALSDWHTAVAREYSRQSVDIPSIRSIQGNLILALRELLARTVDKAWIFTGIAIRQSQALRLGVEYHDRLPNRQKEVQRRTYWAAFVMDRLVAYCCWRPQMIDTDTARINLPCPENLFTFEESFEGPNLETLTFPCEVSRLGLVPYFIATLNLWSQATYIQVKGGRRQTRNSPSDPEGFFRQLERKIDQVHASLPLTMRWSTQNRKIFRHTNQERLFVNFHLLLNHARSVMAEEYLPYRDEIIPTPGHSSVQDGYDETGPWLDGRDERVMSVCMSSSEAIVTMVSELFYTLDDCTRYLQSTFAAGAMLSAANIQLWLQYVQGKDDETCKNAAARVEEITAVFESWKTHWSVADAWLSTLAALRRLYQGTYAPNLSPGNDHQTVGDMAIEAGAPPALTDSDVHERPYPRLTEGNGLPLLKERMSDKIRFILLASLEDTDARERVLHSSMNAVRQHAWEYEAFPEDLEFSFPDFYTDESWSGFVGSYAIGNAMDHELGLEHGISGG